MLKVYNCIVTAHDLRLVVLAAIVCVLASFAAINLLHHSRVAAKAMRPVWLGIAAISTGCGIWATHFIAMLAFSPGIASGYNIALTLLSLVAAIILVGGAFYVAMLAPFRLRRWVGGAMVGGASVNDPVFWMHHAFVDLQWYRWQRRHGGARYLPAKPAAPGSAQYRRIVARHEKLPPWGVTPDSLEDVSGIYRYA